MNNTTNTTYLILYHSMLEEIIQIKTASDLRVILYLIQKVHYNNYAKPFGVFKATVIANDLSISRPMVNKALENLKKGGFIETKHLGSEGQQISLLIDKETMKFNMLKRQPELSDKQSYQISRVIRQRQPELSDNDKQGYQTKITTVIRQNSETIDTREIPEPLNNTLINTKNNTLIKGLNDLYEKADSYGFDFNLIDNGVRIHGRDKVQFVINNYDELVKDDAKNNTEYAYRWVNGWLRGNNQKTGAYEKLRSLTSTSAIKQEIKQEELSEEQKAKLKKEKWEKYEPLHTILPYSNSSSLSNAQYEVALCTYRAIADPYEKKEQREKLKVAIQHIGKEDIIADCKRWWKAEANFMCPGWPEVKELGIDKVIKFVEEFEVG